MNNATSWLFLTLASLFVPLGFVAICFRLRAERAGEFSFLAQFLLFGILGGWCMALGYHPSDFSRTCFFLLLVVAPLLCLLSSAVLALRKRRNFFDRLAMQAGYGYLGCIVVAAVIFSLTTYDRGLAGQRYTLGDESGTWENDPRNWQRAFGERPPQDLQIIRSWYCRTPHFTHESQYFFELAANDTWRAGYAASEAVKEVNLNDNEAQGDYRLAIHTKPAWFAPKAIASYIIYQGKPPQDYCFTLVDRETGVIFITDRIGM